MPKLHIDDIDVNYQEAGHGPPLVFLHGLGGSSEDWEQQIPYFATRYRVLAPDFRGFGGTPAGGRRLSIARLAADTGAFVDAMGLSRFRLVGHSMGGAVALQYALTHPGKIERLVIANSVPSFRPQSARHYLEFLYRLAVMGVLGPAKLAEISAMRQFPEPQHEPLRAKLIARGARNTRATYLAALASLGRWSVIERLHELKMPVLVAASQHDYFGHDETVKFAHALPRGRLHLFKGAHHGLPLEQPDAFNAVLERFLRGAGPVPHQDTVA
ncbi:alpha/beta hydrolase [Fontimonas sp. SYSU GA230001]|uniref:alpha/beta fold hydrolase n=1 Tax=Fontimonas sp. SYSU GA230001 TaxID=3142450 RepID=UPI0032B59ACB